MERLDRDALLVFSALELDHLQDFGSTNGGTTSNLCHFIYGQYGGETIYLTYAATSGSLHQAIHQDSFRSIFPLPLPRIHHIEYPLHLF